MRKSAVAIVLLPVLAGCATTDGYSQFFTPMPGISPAAITVGRADPPPPVPDVIHLDGPFDQSTQLQYMREGYLPVGYSSFTSGYRQSDADAIKEGKTVGADLVVILNPRFSRSITTTIPWTTPTTTTSYSSGTATAYGPGGGAVAFGSSTTTTYGTSTAYVPMTVNRFQYGALYLVKMRYRMGLRFRDLSDAERQQLQSNHGVYVFLVVDGTPAYQSDILPGDIITSVDGMRIDDAASLTRMLPSLNGQAVTLLTIDRDGKTIIKAINLPP